MSQKENMFVAILVSVILCAVNCATTDRNNDSEQNCDLVRPFFETRNISLQTNDNTNGPVCAGKCCSASTENSLRQQVQRDFSLLLQVPAKSLQGLLDTTASTLQNHIVELTRQSENKTSTLFSQVYRSMSPLSSEPIRNLYEDARRYIQPNESSMFTNPVVDIKTSVIKFFTDLFPLVHHHNRHSKDFHVAYKTCLRERIGEIQPFGDIPRQIAQSLSKSLEATRLLLQSFNVGIEVLNTTDALITEEGSGKECHEALLKMTYCPKCMGHQKQAKPCSGYCLNVLRGCLTSHVTELDSPWNGYVEAMERLVIAAKQHNNEAGVNADAVIRALETRISEAIMYAMENEVELDNRVKKACGPARFVDGKDISTNDLNIDTTTSKSSKPQRQNVNLRDTPPLETKLLHFLASVAKSRGFYANLADNVCKYESFAETKDQNCWNGQRIGEYTKTVVDAGIPMQKYNPEMKFSAEMQNADQRIANLAEKLRHVHNLVISALGSVTIPESDNFMQGDAADGSGSGYGQSWGRPDDEDEVEQNGSGSGNGPDRPDIDRGIDHIDRDNDVPPRQNENSGTTGGSSQMAASSLLVILSLLRIYKCFG